MAWIPWLLKMAVTTPHETEFRDEMLTLEHVKEMTKASNGGRSWSRRQVGRSGGTEGENADEQNPGRDAGPEVCENDEGKPRLVGGHVHGGNLRRWWQWWT